MDVKPGSVLISLRQILPSSQRKKSTRERPRQPKVKYALTAAARTFSLVSSGKSAGIARPVELSTYFWKFLEKYFSGNKKERKTSP